MMLQKKIPQIQLHLSHSEGAQTVEMALRKRRLAVLATIAKKLILLVTIVI